MYILKMCTELEKFYCNFYHVGLCIVFGIYAADSAYFVWSVSRKVIVVNHYHSNFVQCLSIQDPTACEINKLLPYECQPSFCNLHLLNMMPYAIYSMAEFYFHC
jgi:hypothetical protein